MAPSTIVLLHGFTQTGRGWGPTIAALRERYRALAPDIRGHGTSAAARPVDFAAVRADVLALAPRRFALAGYSMGGRIALSIALHPAARDRVCRLVLIGASPGIADAEERRARQAADDALADRIEEAGIEQFAAGRGRRGARDAAVAVARRPRRRAARSRQRRHGPAVGPPAAARRARDADRR